MMTYNTRKFLIVGFGTLFLFLLPPLMTLLGESYFLSLASRILIYALAAVSLDLLLGFGGLISLGHAAYVGIGAYVVGIFFFHASEMEPLFTVPFMLSGSENGLFVFPAAMLISALFALVIGALCLRTKGMHFIMITLAFAQMIYYFFVSLEKYGGDDGLSMYSRSSMPFGLDLSDDVHFYYFCLILLCGTVFLTRRLVRSRFGLALRGSSNNQRRLNALGINGYSYQLTCFVIAGSLAGLAGALLANQTEYVSPGLMHWTLSGQLMVMVLMGGLGTIYGPVIGAAVFLLLEEFLAMYTEHWMVFMGPFLVLVVIFAKRGIFGLLTGEDTHNG